MELITRTGVKFRVTEKTIGLVNKLKSEISLHGTVVKTLPFQNKQQIVAKHIFDTILFHYFQEYDTKKEYYGSHKQHKRCKYTISTKASR